MVMRVSLWSIVLPFVLFLPENITFQRKRPLPNMSVSPAIIQAESDGQRGACVLNLAVKRWMVTKGKLVADRVKVAKGTSITIEEWKVKDM
jgi:hypothetical protein